MERFQLTIIIVNFNTKNLLKKNLTSIYKYTKNLDFEIIVVDNASKDGSKEMVKKEFPQVKLIENKENLGFSKANNQAIKISKGKYILLLNSDTEIKDNIFKKMLDFMEKNQNAALISPKILFKNGQLDQVVRGEIDLLSAFLSIFGIKRERYFLKNWNPIEPVEVKRIAFTAALFRKKVFKEVGLLDSDFVIYFEDADYCKRLTKKGFKIYYLPQISLFHFGGASSTFNYEKTLNHYICSLKLFYQKHEAKKYPLFLNLLIYFGIEILRLKMLLGKFFNPQKRLS